jgi:hypothetical protein
MSKLSINNEGEEYEAGAYSLIILKILLLRN